MLSSAYVDAYSSFPSAIVQPAGSFRFDTIQAASGITSSGPPADSFTIQTTGTYMVSFTGAAQGPVRLRVNSIFVGPEMDMTGCGPGTLCSFSRIVTVNAGDVIDVLNVGTTVELDRTGTGITVVRIA